ncbi:hypothetical protein D8674_000990 [Pyrus ussuriensis x Pyrus communis]|uniref:Uncharacterized protein n=1 Tax=Pyrus ussuriensis x Pyrus communis TaxID=2448454 RepID=A0A5N5FAC0_9ROSA|nr:hypothetical protein D8674_000990 [Pyrus ussuriensis x Pyrus communis]
MQLERCLKFVRPEIGSYALESSHEQLLEDLSEIQTRLQGQLKESQLAIKAKDLELASLRASSMNVKLERITTSEPVEEYILDNREICKEWNECIDSYETESRIRQEIERLTTSETIKGVVKTTSDELDQYRDTVTTQFIRRKLIFLVIKWMTLCDHSPVLQHYSKASNVSDISQLIKVELTGVVNASKN